MFITQQLGDGSYRLVDGQGNVVFHVGLASAPTYEYATAASATVQTSQSGTGNYAPGNILTLRAGSDGIQPTFLVTHTKVVFASVVNGGTGGTPGAATFVGTTGTGTPFQGTGTIGGDGVLAGAVTISVNGDYTTNPTSLAAEPVTGGGLVGATLLIKVGVKTVAVDFAGRLAAVPSNPIATSGAGAGCTLNVTWAYSVTDAISSGYMVLPTNTPASASAAGLKGSVAWDASFIYVCVDKDTWKRAAIATW